LSEKKVAALTCVPTLGEPFYVRFSENAIGFHLQRSAQNHFCAAKAMFSQAAREVLTVSICWGTKADSDHMET
jgi:hypothetical protein